MLDWLLALLRQLALTLFLTGRSSRVPRFSKQVQGDGSWRLYDHNDEPIGRIWLTAHIDRILRDGDLAEIVAGIMAQPTGAARRSAARTAYNDWLTAGGHAVNFSALTHSLNDDAGNASGNRHLYIAGNELGYLSGVNTARDLRLQRFVRLAEEVWSGEQNGTAPVRNAALEAAIDRFRDDGGLT